MDVLLLPMVSATEAEKKDKPRQKRRIATCAGLRSYTTIRGHLRSLLMLCAKYYLPYYFTVSISYV